MKRHITAAVVKLTKGAKENLASTTTNPKVLYRLAFDPEIDVVDCVACNEATPEAALFVAVDAINDKYTDRWDRRRAMERLIKNPNCGENLITYIVSNGYCTERDVANRILDKSPSYDILSLLCCSPEREVRQAVASYCKNIPSDLFDQLATDADYNVRREIADRADTPAVTLEVMSYDPESVVRTHAVSNPNMPKQIVLDYWQDLDNYLSIQAVGNYFSTGLSNPRITSSELTPIVDFICGISSGTFEENKGVFTRVITTLGDNPKILVSDLAKLCSLPFDNTGELANYAITGTFRHNGSKLPASLQTPLERKVISGEFTNLELISKVIPTSKNPEFLRTVVNRTQGGSGYDYGYGSRHSCRRAAARNRNTPISCLEALSRDRSRDIASEAKKTLAIVSKASMSGPASSRSTGWAISPYNLEEYSDIADDLDVVIPKLMDRAAKELGCKLTYQFDVDNYDDASEITVTADNGVTFVLDAQRFLAQLTSDNSKITGSNRTLGYIVQAYNAQRPTGDLV